MTEEEILVLKKNWKQLTEKLKDVFEEEPDLQTVIFLIGVQESGLLARSFSKEEKTNLMHIATCKLLSYEGYYSFSKTDEEGWPHYDKRKPIPAMSLKEQDIMLKKAVLKYFKDSGFFIPE
ncbi:MAG: hypothetical protein JNL47_10945 [Bacteroidia bacterium]|nr:hypothetical protein [Bacteroidia bacterium]